MRQSWILFALAALGCAGRSPSELAQRDIATVFFIAKSDDRNRVDYGMRLDRDCVPQPQGMFPYWHEFEPVERTHALGVLEDRAYGIDDQHLVSRADRGAVYVVKLRELSRPITIVISQRKDGTCTASAHARIQSVDDAELSDGYAHLAGLVSVDYIELHGRDPRSGAPLSERIGH
jgi:hypothetical protein